MESNKKTGSYSKKSAELTAIQDLLFTATDGAMAMDGNGKILLWNSSAQRILGFSKAEAEGKICFTLCQGEDPAGNPYCFQGCAAMNSVRRGRCPENFDMKVITKSGDEVWINVTTLFRANPTKRPDTVIIHLFKPIQPSSVHFERLTERLEAVLRSVEEKASIPRDGTKPVHSSSRLSSLTKREREILSHLAKGLVPKEIALSTKLSTATVRTYVQRILKKLRVHSTLEAVLTAVGQLRSRDPILNGNGEIIKEGRCP